MKLLDIKSIKFDKKLYPRENYAWQSAYSYAQSMRAGAKFPPILVAQMGKEYVLVDGKHRLEALKMNKQKHVQAEVKKNWSPEQIYIEAIKQNIKHGVRFNAYEKAKMIARLQDMHYDMDRISRIVQMPLDNMKKLIADRMTSTITGEEVILKSSYKHLAGQEIGDRKAGVIDFTQAKQSNTFTQIGLLNELIKNIENNMLDLKNKKIVEKIIKLKKLLRKVRV